MRKKLLTLSLVLLSGLSFAQTIQLTNGGSTTTTSTTGAAPISAYFEFMRFQVVYTAAELTAAGVTGPQAISQLGWYVSTAPASALPNYKIRMANTTATNSATHDATALTEVYSNASYAPTAGGFNMLTLNGAFIWDGTSNLLVDVCFGAAPYVSPYGQVRTYAATTSNGSRMIRCDGCGSQCNINTSSVNSFKPQVSLTFAAPPSCLAPTGLNAVPAATTASLSWGSVAGASGYQWAVTTSATPPAGGTATAATTATATGLADNTQYYLHVRANCAGPFSTWSTTSFITSCLAATIPYLENFETVTAPTIPNCLTLQDLNGATTWSTFNNTGTPPILTATSGTKSIRYSYSGTSPADDWFYTQGLNLTGGTSYQLTFKYKASNGPTFVERLEVLYGGSPNAAAMTAGTLLTDNNINMALADAFRDGQANFTPASSGVYYIGFHCTSIADQAFLYVDDISVTLTPTCGLPTALSAVATGTGTTANLSWTAPTVGTPTGYEWAVTTSATPPASGTAIAGTTATASGLTAATAYFLHVRTNCGAGGFSSWATISFTTIANDECSGAITITTQANGASCVGATAASTTGATPSAQLSSCWSSSLNDDIWYRFTATATSVVLNVSNFTATTGTATELGFVIYNDTSNCSRVIPANELTTACPAVTITSGAGTASFGGLVVGNTYTLRLFAVGSANSASFNFCLMDPPPPPPCVTNVSPANGATGVVLGANGSTSISWNATPSATGYNIFFGTTNPPTTNIGNVTAPTTTASLNSLSYTTTYYWYIQPVNSGSLAVGCSTNVTSFTTGTAPSNCIPITSSGCSLADRLELFRLKGETSELNINTGTTCNSNAYTDTTDHPVVIDVARGKTYWGQAKAGATSDYITAWLDDNDNGIFEDDERLLNNLPLSTTSIRNINMHIPLSTATGNHRLRIRLVWYSNPPTAPTNPCTGYTYSDTKDFTVNVLAGGTPYTVSTYTTTGSCYTGTGVITVDSLSNNNLGFVPLVDSSNNIMAQLYPVGNNLGAVTTSYYKHNGPVRQDAGGRYYLDRNLTITVATQPLTPYNLRFPYQNSELNALIAQPGSGVTSQFDLTMTKNGDACLNAIGTGGTGGAVFFPTGFGSISGDRFVDVTNITGGFSSFYLHGGSTAIPVNLVNFMVQRTGKVNSISWSTSQEVNTSHFVIERSNDGRSFTEIGQVTANGNSNALLNYGFVDNNPIKGINYYRLRVVDRDNSAKYSAIRSVRNEGLADVSIFPNPVNDLLTVSIAADKAELGAITVTDMTGKIVLTRSIAVAQGDNRLPVNTAALASGTYIIKVQLNDDMVVRKFNKQ
jgi:hypothetical protein